jgi:hypothetical protein
MSSSFTSFGPARAGNLLQRRREFFATPARRSIDLFSPLA